MIDLRSLTLSVLTTFLMFGNVVAQQTDLSLEGVWEGTGTQTDGQSWRIELTVNGGSYRVVYPSLSCRGQWFAKDKDAKTITFLERIEPNSRCLDFGTIVVEKLSETQIRFRYSAKNSSSILARGILNKNLETPQRSPQQPQPRSTVPHTDDSVSLSKDPIHKAGTKLVETELYTLYKHRPYYQNLRQFGDDEFCLKPTGVFAKNEARVAVVFKVNADYVITDDAEYRRRFEQEMWPVINAECPRIQVLTIYNYVQDVRINHNGKEYGYKQSPPDGFEEYPLNWVSVYIEEGRFRFAPRTNVDLGGRTYPSLASLRKTLAKTAADAVESKRSTRERLRQNHLATARDVLSLLKSGAPPAFSFAGYSSEKVFESIYAGNFEQFTGGADSLEEATSSVGTTFGNADPRNPFGFLSDLMSTAVEVEGVKQRRRQISLIFYAYHNIYKDLCSSNKEVRWTNTTPYEFYKTRNDEVIPGSQRDGVVIMIREPFKDVYDGVYRFLADSSNPSPAIPQNYASDFRQLFKAEGCASPAVRQFEINIYLAAGWMLPVQELRPTVK